jgi:cytochrome c-type biogenesis protein CcmE
MSPTNRNRMIAVIALLVAGAGLAFIAFGNIGENLVYYWSPSEMVAQGSRAYGPTIRLGGIVEAKSIQWNPEYTSLTFRVADNKEPGAAAVTVASTQTPPQMFREGIGVVVEGSFDKSQVFKTNRLMVNHSNEYRPPKPGEKPRDWKDTVSDSTGSAPKENP